MALNAPADPGPARPPRGRRALDSLWFAASAPQVTIALAVLLALTFALAALIPQLPAGLDPAAASRWLSTTSASIGRFGPFLSSSGLLNILGGPWITGLVALTAFHLALRSANQLRRLVRAHAEPPLAPHGLPFELVRVLAEPLALETRIVELTQGHGRHWVRSTGDAQEPSERAGRSRIDAFAERGTWAAAGPLLTYLGPLLIAGGLLWNTVAGWRVTDLSLTPGRVSQPAQAGGLSLALVAAADANTGQPGVLTLSRENETRDAWIDEGRPARWGNVWIAQRSSGPALAVTAEVNGGAAPLQALEEGERAGETLRLRFGENESEQGFAIPATPLAFRVVSYESLPERGIERPVFLVEGFVGTNDTPQLNELVEDERVVEWQGARLTLRRDRYVVVDLASTPGLPLLLLGGLTLVAGAAITAWGGLTRMWINAAAEEDGTLLAARSAAPATGQRAVKAVVDAATGEGPTARLPGISKLLFGSAGWAAVTLVAGVAAAAALLIPALTALPPQLNGLFIARSLLAGFGIGAWLPAFLLSARWALTSTLPHADAPEGGQAPVMQGRMGDPGRGLALAGFPLLVAAALVGAALNLFAVATPLRTVAGEMWLLAALCAGAAYLHATSGWRPLRLPAWLAVILALVTALAGAALLLTGPSLLAG